MSKTKYKLSEVIRSNLKADNKRFWAGDNISEYISEEQKQFLIDEATEAFEGVLDSLLIDRETDPNSQGTARRLAKMYFNEIMAGRYEPAPDATAFPNDSADRYEGITLELLPLTNLSVYLNTLGLLSGVLAVELYKKNLQMISQEK